MDITFKKPVFAGSLVAIAVLATLSAVALVKINTLHAQEDSLVTTNSFACEPLVFSLAATDESEEATGSGTPRATATASASASPTASPKGGVGTGGTSPTPSASATATARPTSTATVSPTPTATAKPATLPDAGVGAPTIIGAAAGVILLVAAALLAL